MPTYNYSMVYIENLANLKVSLLISDRVSCRVYDSEGSITNRCRNDSIYNLVIKQDVVYGDPGLTWLFTKLHLPVHRVIRCFTVPF